MELDKVLHHFWQESIVYLFIVGAAHRGDLYDKRRAGPEFFRMDKPGFFPGDRTRCDRFISIRYCLHAGMLERRIVPGEEEDICTRLT